MTSTTPASATSALTMIADVLPPWASTAAMTGVPTVMPICWPTEACRAVASLRLVAGRTPGDRALAELVGDLCIRSTDFARMWAHHPIAECVTGRKLLHHPALGDLDLDFEVLQPADGSGQRLITYMPAPEGPTAAALRSLAAATCSSPPTPTA
ncbi:hypothetical protein ACQPZJ_33920 [Actinoplanes sp. CA-054009]